MSFARSLAVMVLVAGCDAPRKEVTDVEATDIAGLYVEKNCPQMTGIPMRPIPSLRDSVWLVTYAHLNGARVGAVEVHVDKPSGRVLRVQGTACARRKESESYPTLSEAQAITIANNYVMSRYGPTLRNTIGAAARDQGSSLIVTYQLPEGSIGGTPTVEIDKRTRRVIYARHTQ